MLKFIKTLVGVWNKFWFSSQPTYALGVFRIFFGLFIILILVISYPNWDRFYGPEGSLPLSTFDQSLTSSWSIFTLTDQAWFIWAIYWFAIAAALSLTVGFKTRFVTISLFVIFASMMHRNFYLINGQDQVTTMLLFFSSFAPLGSSFSIDAKRSSWEVSKPMWSTRLMQVSIAIIYIFAGPAKYFDDITWRDGSAIYYISLSDRWFRFFDVSLFHNEILGSLFTFGALFMEIAFPVLVWFPFVGPLVLAGIALMHFSMLILMGPSVFYFNLVMLVSFILFVKPETIKYLVGFLNTS